MFVNESAAAGCGIPSCDSLRKNLSKLHNADNAEIMYANPLRPKICVFLNDNGANFKTATGNAISTLLRFP